MAQVRFAQVKKQFGDNLVIPSFDLDVRDREFLVLVGPSGCGKSTLLRMLAGLEETTDGAIYIDDRRVNDLPPKDRDIAMVFQNYALYPHMNVRRNMAFGLKMRKVPKDQIESQVNEAARILEIEPLLDRKPAQLSGGQRQRVAMGRAIVRQPKVFLFDEPLSNLDAKLRVQMRLEIKQLHGRLRTTILYVTHDQVEAMTLADRIAVLDRGVLQQVAAPTEVYERPANAFVAGFIGSPTMNFLPAEIADEGGRRFVRAASLAFPWPDTARPPSGCALTLGIRPEHLHLEPSPGNVKLDATFELLEPLGGASVLYARAGDSLLNVLVDMSNAAFSQPERQSEIHTPPSNADAPQPEAASPQPETANPQPEAANPQPETANPQPETAQPSTSYFILHTSYLKGPLSLYVDPAQIHLFDAATGANLRL